MGIYDKYIGLRDSVFLHCQLLLVLLLRHPFVIVCNYNDP